MRTKLTAFPEEEYRRRLELVRYAMYQAGIDLLYVTNPSNMGWLTGYDGWSFYVHQGVLISFDDDPIWWGRRMDANGALLTVWMGDEYVVGYPDLFIQNPDIHPMQDLSQHIRALGLDTAVIGVEKENFYYSAKAHEELLKMLPEAELRDATNLVNWERRVKSDFEIEFMRRAARISEKIVDGFIERIEPGLAKNDLVAEIYRDAISGADGHWGDYPAIVPMLPSGAHAAAPHLAWDGRAFETGEATFLESAGCYRRYHVPFCRTVFLGEPPDEMKRAEAALVEGLEAGIDWARAGNRACDIANALAVPLERAGIERGARCGYSVGLSYPPDWGEHTISLRAEDTTVLEPGMTFHFMPGLWMNDWGVEITETILIREEGPAETLCNRPRQITVKP
ncbi:M24 family metallopeptidase [Roseivivax sp. CAU 1761]